MGSLRSQPEPPMDREHDAVSKATSTNPNRIHMTLQSQQILNLRLSVVPWPHYFMIVVLSETLSRRLRCQSLRKQQIYVFVLCRLILAAFNEKSMFPKYILDFELKMRNTQEKINKNLRNSKPMRQVGDPCLRSRNLKIK